MVHFNKGIQFDQKVIGDETNYGINEQFNKMLGRSQI